MPRQHSAPLPRSEYPARSAAASAHSAPYPRCHPPQTREWACFPWDPAVACWYSPSLPNQVTNLHREPRVAPPATIVPQRPSHPDSRESTDPQVWPYNYSRHQPTIAKPYPKGLPSVQTTKIAGVRESTGTYTTYTRPSRDSLQ